MLGKVSSARVGLSQGWRDWLMRDLILFDAGSTRQTLRTSTRLAIGSDWQLVLIGDGDGDGVHGSRSLHLSTRFGQPIRYCVMSHGIQPSTFLSFQLTSPCASMVLRQPPCSPLSDQSISLNAHGSKPQITVLTFSDPPNQFYGTHLRTQTASFAILYVKQVHLFPTIPSCPSMPMLLYAMQCNAMSHLHT